VNLSLDDTQRALRAAVATLLDRLDPPTDTYDVQAEEQLRAAGFLDLPRDAADGGLLAVMVVEDVARSCRNLAIGAHALVLPALGWHHVEGPVAMPGDGPARHVHAGGHVLVVDGDDARLAIVDSVEVTPSSWGPALGRPILGPTVEVRAGAGSALVSWARLAVAAELVGLTEAALGVVVEHLGGRVQFGRPLTAQQALRHRLALLRTRIDGSRLLVYRAGWANADGALTLEATTYTAAAGTIAVRELHQLCGSIGLTEEFDLHRFTARILTLCAELGGAHAQRRALAQLRWPGPPDRAVR
jgi:alkylation response protein AidB-like acyl-CoA dehydrogenase